ncbi:MAG: TIGR02117 family protein [Planctomycetota bacterium]
MIWLCLGMTLSIAAVVLVGLIPTNNEFVPVPEDQPGVDIYVTSNAVHADIIVPFEVPATETTPSFIWRETFPESDFPDAAQNGTHAAVGWGDQGFYIHTPRWADLKISVALKAMFWPSPTCLHVDCVRPEQMRDKRRVRISHEQYAELVKFIDASLARNPDGEIMRIADAGYTSTDAFYEATGTYWFFYTCNSWVGRAMSKTGIRTPLMTPLPKSMMLYLPESDAETELALQAD